jgi:hypothetical protein
MRVWRLEAFDGTSSRVRLVLSAAFGARLEIDAGLDQMAVASARFHQGRWVVTMPMSHRTVRARDWLEASEWMLEELHQAIDGRLVPVPVRGRWSD